MQIRGSLLRSCEAVAGNQTVKLPHVSAHMR